MVSEGSIHSKWYQGSQEGVCQGLVWEDGEGREGF